MVEKYLKMFTFLPVSEIEQLMKAHQENPGARKAQEALAREVTGIVHGKDAAENATQASGVLFGKEPLSTLNTGARTVLLKEAPTVPVLRKDIAQGLSVIDVLATSTLAGSKSEARRLVEAKGVSLNGAQVSDVAQNLSEGDFGGGLALLKKGRREAVILVLK